MNSSYYQERINKALAYLNQHLQEDIRVEKLAKISHFSLFHFQRIYKALQGESPYETLFRLRLEKAVFLLKHQANLKISTIALECGFPSVENFSRQFKARYQVSPSAFKKNKALQNSRIYQEDHPNDFYHYIEESRKAELKTFPVKIETLEAIPIAFIRGIFGTDGSVLVARYHELINWAQKHKLHYQGALTRFGMSIDNPEVTPANKYRYDFALRLDRVVPLEGLIEIGEIPKGNYVTLHCKGKLETVAQAWDYLYKHWLPNQNYMPIHYPAIEEFVKGPEEIGWDNFDIKCRIPVQLQEM